MKTSIACFGVCGLPSAGAMNSYLDTERLSELTGILRERTGDAADTVRERLEQVGGEKLLKGAAAGFVGGLVGTWCMGLIERGWNRVEARWSPGHNGRAEMRKGHENAGATERPQQSEPRSHHHRITPGERVAATFSRAVLHRPIDPHTRELAGSALHYAFGGSAGALYGAAAELDEHVTVGAGTLFGTAVWLLADEIGVSMTGLAPSPLRTPPRRHAYSLAAHLAFGFGTELARRVLRGLI